MSDAPTPAPSQPKILQKMLLRFAIGLFLLAGLFLGYQWLRDRGQDLDFGTANTVGWLAAVELLEEGSRAVAILPDGTVRPAPGHSEGKVDRDLSWRPDGNRLFFLSNREGGAFNIYRWNLASDEVVVRSFGTRSKGRPTFLPPDVPGANETALITSGGFVLEFNPRDGSTAQVLPPVTKERQGDQAEGTGAIGQFDALYQRLGTAFRAASWMRSRSKIVAIMTRDIGEVLIVQDLGSASPPIPVIAGMRIDFDVNQRNGDVYFTVQDFMFTNEREIPAEFIRDGVATPPFRAAIGRIPAPRNGQMPPPEILAASPDEEVGFTSVRVAPDGSAFLFLTGRATGNGNITADTLSLAPTGGGPIGARALRLIRGRVFEPSWSPDSQTIAYAKYDEQNKRSIFTVRRDGSNETNITKGNGEFAFPIFSPQVPSR
ncbi:MAG: hypothetical protein SNJ74_05895 [Fimbriimonadaceae bacterium]